MINDGRLTATELERAIIPYRNRISYLRQENKGAGARATPACERRADASSLFLMVTTPTYQRFWPISCSSSDLMGGYDLVYADATNFGEFTPDGLTNMDVNQSHGAVDAEALISGRCCVITSAVLARRDLILEVGLFD